MTANNRSGARKTANGVYFCTPVLSDLTFVAVADGGPSRAMWASASYSTIFSPFKNSNTRGLDESITGLLHLFSKGNKAQMRGRRSDGVSAFAEAGPAVRCLRFSLPEPSSMVLLSYVSDRGNNANNNIDTSSGSKRLNEMEIGDL
ncbi:hypothetical protein EVAR_29550_1 [Eumeta japonica]|uniref:Uncharacterized protein n=1 Tax=Eumeta variegata TaxID=151549 RepID=A0A4C1WIG7_EUMVA|nr:hypothetical protein EVAR_29550_1 [Eumeta japonica]